MLRGVPRSLFSWDFDVLQDGVPIAVIDMAWFRERGELDIAGQRYEVYRESWMGGRFFIESSEGPLASAEKPSALFRSFVVDYDGRRLQLEAASPFTRRFLVLENDVRIGTIGPDFWLSRKATIDLPQDIPVPVQVFMFWLVLLLRRRAANSSSSAGGA